MFNIVFYEKENGRSELWDFIEALRISSSTNKDSRIQYRQIILHIQMLQDNGTMLPEVITKHLDEDIWELRPGNNREYAKSAGSEDRREIEDCERLSHAISLAINGLHNFGLCSFSAITLKKERTVKSSE